MDLKEAIKTCLEANVTVMPMLTTEHTVWLPHEIFLQWFKEYEVCVETENERLQKLVAVKDGIEYNCHRWKGE